MNDRNRPTQEQIDELRYYPPGLGGLEVSVTIRGENLNPELRHRIGDAAVGRMPLTIQVNEMYVTSIDLNNSPFYIQGMPRSVQVIGDPTNHMTHRNTNVVREKLDPAFVERCRIALQSAGLIPRDMRDMEPSVHQIVNAAIGSGKPEER